MNIPSEKRVLSAAQPTGELHIGNYLGALTQWVELQNAGNSCIFPIVDLHAITVPYDPKTFSDTVLKTAAVYLAVGLDPTQSTVFIQSHVPAHAEAAWLLTTITPYGDLTRMTQFKEKGAKQKTIGTGLFAYPILMAADILLYRTELVPVGDDQLQHLEFTRTLARKFNQQFGKTFTEPKAFLLQDTARIMSLTDPRQKMSKSDKPESRIGLLDDPTAIEKKIRAAMTDSGTAVNPKKVGPAMKNLFILFSAFSKTPPSDVTERYAGQGYAVFKKALTELLIDQLSPIRTRASMLLQDRQELRSILAKGSQRATVTAQKTLASIKERMGLLSAST